MAEINRINNAPEKIPQRIEDHTIGLFFKVFPEEMELIQKKMEQAGTINKRAYLRKMAVDGYIVHLEMESVKELCKSSFDRER